MRKAVDYQKYIKFVLLTSVAITFIYFFINDFNPSGVLSIYYDLCTPSPYISELSPHGRVLDIEKREGYCAQRMVIEPVYVDVRLPQRYDRVTMKLRYQKEESVPLSYGVRTSFDGWQWDLKPAQIHDASKLLRYKDWKTASVQFDISRIPLDHRRMRFMLSSPHIDVSGKEIVIREVYFHFEKSPFGWEMTKRWIASFLW